MLFTCTDDMFLSRNGRHRKGKRRKSAGPISEPPTPTVTLELIDQTIKDLEDEQLRCMHLAAMRTGVHERFMGPNHVLAPDEGYGDETRLRHLGNALACSVDINALACSVDINGVRCSHDDHPEPS